MVVFGTAVSNRNRLAGVEAGASQHLATRVQAEMPAAPGSVERRSERRNRTLKPALLSFNGGTLKAEAVLRDINGNGARLKLEDPFALPHEAIVEFKDETGKTLQRKARMIWRSKNEAGISFS